jgi:hypothetical protein
MKSPFSLAVAGLLAASMAQPAFAQPYVSAEAQYQQQMREYERQRQIYEQNQRDYEARYGAYQRGYTPPPDPRYDPRYDDRPYDNRPYDNRYADNRRYDDPYRAYANSPCERRGSSSGNTAAGTIIGALIGGALGANIASEKVETEGAVLGAVVGGAIGAGIANSADNNRYVAQCDARGYYFTYEQTYPYREDYSMRGRRSGQYDATYYSRQRCRLAVGPADINGRSDYRYVRVCPDRDNRYRITS